MGEYVESRAFMDVCARNQALMEKNMMLVEALKEICAVEVRDRASAVNMRAIARNILIRGMWAGEGDGRGEEK